MFKVVEEIMSFTQKFISYKYETVENFQLYTTRWVDNFWLSFLAKLVKAAYKINIFYNKVKLKSLEPPTALYSIIVIRYLLINISI